MLYLYLITARIIGISNQHFFLFFWITLYFSTSSVLKERVNRLLPPGLYRCFAKDALVAARMNVNPGGRNQVEKPLMRATSYVRDGVTFQQEMTMQDNQGKLIPKGMRRVSVFV